MLLIKPFPQALLLIRVNVAAASWLIIVLLVETLPLKRVPLTELLQHPTLARQRRVAMQVLKKYWFWVLLALAVGLLTLHTTSPVSRYTGGLPETRTQQQQLISPDTPHEHTANAAGER